MSEKGKVIALENNIATVALKKNSACKSCGLCLVGKDAETMILNALALPNTKIGDEVFVTIDKKIKSSAIFWLLGFPILSLVGTAVISRVFLNLSEDLSFLLSVGGLVFAFVLAWFADKKAGWSKKPVAKIVSNPE